MKNTRMQKEFEDRVPKSRDLQENKAPVAALGAQMKPGFLHLLSRCLLLKAFKDALRRKERRGEKT